MFTINFKWLLRRRFSQYWPPIMFFLVCVALEASYTWYCHKVSLNEREDLQQTKLLVDHKPSMADWRSECVCFQPCLVSFLSFCLYVCVPSVLPHTHTVSKMNVPVPFQLMVFLSDLCCYFIAVFWFNILVKGSLCPLSFMKGKKKTNF